MDNELKTKRLLNDDYLDFGVDVKKTVNPSIGQPKVDENGRTVKDENGHIVYEWREPVKYTISFRNCTLDDLAMLACDSVVVKIANRNRPGGLEIVRALNGKTFDAKALITGRVKMAKSVKIEKLINEMIADGKDDEAEELIKRLSDKLKNK